MDSGNSRVVVDVTVHQETTKTILNAKNLFTISKQFLLQADSIDVEDLTNPMSMTLIQSEI